ncbi:MAG: excinuclease ABC subunit UvrA [Bacteroidia bacterium]|nr:excinuclease ABC subunit UvrA [Bacteroidia bacterium]
MHDQIIIRGASENNLKFVDVEIPHNKITVVTGVSGSGKSSLMYDIIFREGQRRYLESFSGYARHFLGKLKRPAIHHISGLKPAIAIDQKSIVSNSRSTVGTMSGLYDYLRLLFARLGKCSDDSVSIKPERRLFSFNSGYGSCPVCKGLGIEEKIDPLKLIEDPEKSLSQRALVITAPNGYIIYSQVTMDVLNQVCNAHGFDVHIPWNRLTEEQKHIILYGSDIITIPFGKHPLESRMNWSGITAKPREEGYYKGIIPIMEEILKRDRNENILRFVSSVTCSSCHGQRLRKEALSFYFHGLNISELCNLTIDESIKFFHGLSFSNTEMQVGESIQKVFLKRAVLMQKLGLGYLTLSRESTTLSGGEAQRIRLATQAGCGLRNVLYILDEPSIGLHPKDNKRLLGILKELRDNGNTVIVVEHDNETILSADYLIDMGPKAGNKGGEILFCGFLNELSKTAAAQISESTTLAYLYGKEKIDIPHSRRNGDQIFTVRNASKNNLKNIDVHFKTAAFNVITGVSGAGKSSLVEELIHQFKNKTLEGFENIDKIIEVDQSPIGRTPKSNPATYTKLFDHIRDLFANLPESKTNGFDKGRFSFNVKGGRCENCEGAGVQQIGMHFLGNVDLVCDTCNGQRFNKDTLAVLYNGKSIFDVLELTVLEAQQFFSDKPKIMSFLNALANIGLGYLTLGQNSTTLSGGEAQRVKLAAELARPSTWNTLYIFDEPTTGLHSADIKVILNAFASLVNKGNTIIAIEHNLDFIKTADWVIDLGPGSGKNGGELIIENIPEKVAICEQSFTGKELSKVLNQESSVIAAELNQPVNAEFIPGPIIFKGVTTHNLKNINVNIPVNKITVITGVSGSGKSSLAFDTVFAEGQNRFSENFPAFARTFMNKAEKADFEECSGIMPAIAVNQKIAMNNPRSTVGTITEIYDYIRLLYSRAGKSIGGANVQLSSSMFSFNHEQGACPLCKGLGNITACDPEKLVTHPELSLLNGAMKGTKTGQFYGDIYGQYVHTLITVGNFYNIDFSVPYNKLDSNAQAIAMYGTGETEYDVTWNYKRKNRKGEFHFKTKWPGLVSHVNDEYLRKHADARGVTMQNVMTDAVCPECLGNRLKKESLEIYFAGYNIADLCNLSISEMIYLLGDLENSHGKYNIETAVLKISVHIREEILKRLKFLENTGLPYLTLNRKVNTISGGEAQRLRLASQLGSGLTGVLYVLDEPTVGLHPHDTEKLIDSIRKLKETGNTVVIVEHDEDMIRCADHIMDLGPGAGEHGGQIVACGSFEDIVKNQNSKTGFYFSQSKNFNSTINTNTKTKPPKEYIQINGAVANNLKSMDVTIPTGGITVITGISGSGKTSLLFNVIAESYESKTAKNCNHISGIERFGSVVVVDQEPIGTSPSSNPATYCGIFDEIRNLFASTEQAKQNKFTKNRFSFNIGDGRCDTCQGNGKIRVSMDFLSDVWLHCEDCNGARYNHETLACKFNAKNIAEVLDLTISEAIRFFHANKKIQKPLQILNDVGLGYLRLGQASNTLSGGEAQRLKLAKELLDSKSGNNLYLFDEPTTGLHFEDVQKLILLFNKLTGSGHSVIIVEHNLQIIRNADWIIDLGPEGGDKGGEIVATGTPADIIKCNESFTGKALKKYGLPTGIQ